MKGKISKLLAMPALCLALMSGGQVSAQAASCSITGTGPGSNNVCQFDNTNSIIYTCVNDVLVVNGTNQSATSGVAQSSSNTSSGSVSSGNAINTGQVTTNVNATCAGANPATPPVSTPPAATPPVVTAAVTPAAEKPRPQVDAPRGAVEAGGGGGASESSVLPATAGILGSLGLLALGWRLRNFEQL